MWAEFFGCFILICFGDGVVAMLWALVGSGTVVADGALLVSGDWLLITWGWALAVVFADLHRGWRHRRPHQPGGDAGRGDPQGAAVEQGRALLDRPGVRCFIGAALVFLVYNNAINHYDQVHHIVKGTAASSSHLQYLRHLPSAVLPQRLRPLVDQIVGTFFLVLFVWAVTDEWNLPVGANMTPSIVGVIVMAVGIWFGANAGYAINPARNFGPRIFAWIAGWASWRCLATTAGSTATSGSR